MSFGFRAVASLFTLLIITLLLMWAILHNDAEKHIDDIRQTQVAYQAKMLAEGSIDALVSEDYELLERWVSSSMPTDDYAYATLVRPNGQILNHTESALIGKYYPAFNDAIKKQTRITRYHNRPVVEASYPAMLGKKHIATARVAYFQDMPVALTTETHSRLIIVISASTLLLLLGSYLIIRGLIKPIRQLTDDVTHQSIESDSKISIRIINRKDEIGALAKAFDSLSHRLLNSYHALEKKSHELEDKVIERTCALERKTNTLQKTNQELEKAREELTLHRDNLQKMVDEQTIELINEKENAEASNRAKTVFLANMSHELRTPMHAILSFSELGNKGINKPKEKLQLYFSTINTSGHRLLKLINNLLDISKLESGKHEYKFEKTNLNTISTDCIAELSSLARETNKHIRFSSDTSYDSIEVDVGLIHQVIINLLSNAIKFSPENSDIALHIQDESINNQTQHPKDGVRVSITDNGPGVPENELDDIFNAFTQSSTTNTFAGGTGLGLSICKNIITAHNGKIWVENRKEGGAVFHFTIPTIHEEKLS